MMLQAQSRIRWLGRRHSADVPAPPLSDNIFSPSRVQGYSKAIDENLYLSCGRAFLGMDLTLLGLYM